MKIVKEIISKPITLQEGIDIEILKTRLNNFKKKPNEKIKEIIQKEKMLLTYDDRLDTYFIFSEFLPQYGFYFEKIQNNIAINFFTFENTSENIHTYILYLLYSLNILPEPAKNVESSNIQ